MVTRKKKEPPQVSSRPRQIKVTHPSLGGEVGEVLPTALDAWRKAGWTTVDDGDSKADSTPEADAQPS